MNGFTEDLLNCVADWIARNWKKRGENLSYFVAQVKASGLTVADLDSYLADKGDTCVICVNQVFAAIVYEAVQNGSYLGPEKKGGEE